MMFTTAIFAASLAALATAAPTKTTKRADTCGQWDSVATGAYTVFNDVWGKSSATSGSQCFGVDSLSGSTLKWHSSWSWAGGVNSVKSYPNVVLKASTASPSQLSKISKIPSTFNWAYTGSNIVADVSYDMFTSSSATGSNEFEIMVWLAALGGAGPISSSYGANGKPVAIKTATIGGHSFNLYKGPNGSTTVYSFVATSTINAFTGDLKAFFTYLIANEGLSSNQYLTSIGAGSEPFTGSNAKFTVSAYSASITKA